MVKAGLIACDTGRDPPGAPVVRLGHEVRIRQKRARHGHHRNAGSIKRGLGHLGRVDPVRGDQRDRHLAHHLLRHPCKRRARHARRNRRNARLVPADPGVDRARARRLDIACHCNDVLPGRAAINKVQHRKPVDQDRIVAHRITHRAYNLDAKAAPSFGIPAPVIVALVGTGRHELIDEVALGAHHLDPVIARRDREPGRSGEIGNLRLDFIRAQRARCDRGNRCAHRARGNRILAERITARVQDLHKDASALGVHSVRHHPMFRSVVLGHHRSRAGIDRAFDIGRNAPRHDQAHAAPRPFAVKRRQPLQRRALFQPGVHRTHESAIGQRQLAQRQWREQVRIGGHSVLQHLSDRLFSRAERVTQDPTSRQGVPWRHDVSAQ